jgi:hypothetical protein
MENNTDAYGNIGENIYSPDRIKRYNQKVIERHTGKPLIKILCGVLILGALTGVGIGTYKLVDNSIKADHTNSLKTPNFQDEPVYERRVRFLNQANKQLLHAKTPEEMNGLNAVIRDIEKGVYDYQK